MSAANGTGPMGAGIAGAIRKYGGREIQENAFEVCRTSNPQAGMAYSTISGQLKLSGIKRIIHAVTMKNPGGPTSYELIKSAFESALILAKTEGITTIGCTALGTGIGGLNASKVAKIMISVAKEQKNIDVVFMDFDCNFITTINQEL